MRRRTLSSRRHTDVEVTILGMPFASLDRVFEIETDDFATDAAILVVVVDTTGAQGTADASIMFEYKIDSRVPGFH